jgi:hypothetical protein
MGASDAEDILKGLTEDERKLALSILGEYGETGESKTMDGLLRADYSEVPVDIETFLTDDRYLGKAWKDASGKLKIYPFWMDTLKRIFPNNLDTSYDTLLESGARGLGKAQPLDSPVLTDNGFSPMGEVHIGTKVYGADGKLHNVIGVFPQGNKPVYRVTFSDGKSTLCSDEHLWKVYHINGHGTGSVKALNEIIESGLTTNRDKSGKFGYKYKIPMCSPIDFAEQSHFIDPYVLGCLLGDGGLSTQTVKFTSPDEEIVCAIDDKLIEHGYKLAKYSADYSYGIRRIKHKNSPNEYAEEIRRLGLRCKSDRKHVPDEYLFDSAQNRLALLQGLVDTDGYVDKGGYCVITTTSEKLKDGIVFLVESLGGTAPVRTKRSNHYKTTDGNLKHCLDSYDVSVNLPKGLFPTRLRRKAGRLSAMKHRPSRTIRKAEFVGEMPCQCILVDSDEHLYLTDDFIVTHNSEIACGAVGAYLMYRIMCLKNPLEYYHLKPTEKIIFAFMNITKEASKKIAIDKFQKTVQMSPWFMSRGSMTQFENNPFWVPPNPIQIVIGSQPSDVIGLPIFFCLSGDTTIKTTEGDRRLEDIVGKNIQVVSVGPDGHETISNTCKVLPTKLTNDEYSIELDDGTVINCTGEHRFMLSDGSYKLACELTTDDELFSTNSDRVPFGYIYKFTNTVTNKIYIGKREKPFFDRNYYGSGKSWRADLIKYGKENVRREVICFGYSRKELNDLERHYIKKYDAQNKEVGYNIHKGGQGGNSLNDTAKWLVMRLGEKNGRYHKEVSAETRRRISVANTGKIRSKEFRIRLSAKTRGKRKPIGFGEKVRIAQKGRVKSADEKRHISEGLRHSTKNKGRHRSDETKRKISKALMGRRGLAGERNPMYGKHHTEEAIAKMRSNRVIKRGADNPSARAVLCVDTNEVFGSIVDARKKYPRCTHIGECCRGHLKSTGHLKWRWNTDED